MSPSEERSCTSFLKSTFRIARALMAIVCALAAVFHSAAIAGDSDNPYKIIFQRNVFGLRPPAAQAPATAPTVPSSAIVLTGITTILGEKRAFLEITPPAKPPQPPKQLSCILTEGEREGGVEVIQIDSKAGAVKVSENGTMTTLTFEKNGRKGAPTTPTTARTLPRFQNLRLPIQSQRR